MPRYLIESTYLTEGIKGLLKEGGVGRRAAVENLFASLDGKVESMYFAFGEEDVFIIGDLPDNAAAAALAIKVGASGAAHIKTTMLLTPEDVDAAVRKTSVYRPPGYQAETEVAKWEGEGGHLAGGTPAGE